MRSRIALVLSLLITVFSPQLVLDAHAGEVEYTLWSDDKSCSKDDAFMFAIESHEEYYKVASCSIVGCRIAIKEFGKKIHPGKYREDSKFEWSSESEFEAMINGKKGKFYLCHTKTKQQN